MVASADQASKALSARLFPHPVLNVRGSLVGLPLPAATVVLGAAFALAVALVAHASDLLTTVGSVGLGLALGGAASNLADRVLRGGVVDFIAIGPWPAFNLADAAMVAGAVMVAAGLT